MPTPIPVLALPLSPELVAVAVGEGEAEVVIEEAREVLVMNEEVEVEDDEVEDDEVVALVEDAGFATIVNLLLVIAPVVLPGLKIIK